MDSFRKRLKGSVVVARDTVCCGSCEKLSESSFVQVRPHSALGAACGHSFYHEVVAAPGLCRFYQSSSRELLF
jgi:hypothetical protein